VAFNESEVLRAFDPAAGCIGNFNNDTVKLWYNDEHALTLGVRQVVVKERRCVGGPNIGLLCIANAGCPSSTCGATVTTTTNYPVSPEVLNPDHATNPDTGSNILTGDQAGVDTNTCGAPDCGRPMWPVLFITDIGVDPNPRGGDWQYHNPQINNPNDVFGTWKAAVKTVDRTVSPATTVVTPDADPTKNDWKLDGGDPAGHCSSTLTFKCTVNTDCSAQTPSGQTCVLPKDQGYGAEVRWNVSTLKDKTGAALQPGHTYRFQFIVHDGDQNQAGGDTGEACVNAQFQFSALSPQLAMKYFGNGQTPAQPRDVAVDNRGQKGLSAALRALGEQMSRLLLNLAL